MQNSKLFVCSKRMMSGLSKIANASRKYAAMTPDLVRSIIIEISWYCWQSVIMTMFAWVHVKNVGDSSQSGNYVHEIVEGMSFQFTIYECAFYERVVLRTCKNGLFRPFLFEIYISGQKVHTLQLLLERDRTLSRYFTLTYWNQFTQLIFPYLWNCTL